MSFILHLTKLLYLQFIYYCSTFKQALIIMTWYWIEAERINNASDYLKMKNSIYHLTKYAFFIEIEF